MDGTQNISMATSILIVYAAYLLLLVLPTDVLQRDAIRASQYCIPLVIVRALVLTTATMYGSLCPVRAPGL